MANPMPSKPKPDYRQTLLMQALLDILRDYERRLVCLEDKTGHLPESDDR